MYISLKNLYVRTYWSSSLLTEPLRPLTNKVCTAPCTSVHFTVQTCVIVLPAPVIRVCECCFLTISCENLLLLLCCAVSVCAAV